MINDKYPTTKPSLNLDFANTKSLDPRITFRRGTPGTYYDGVTHAKAEENLLKHSENFTDSSWDKYNTSVESSTEIAPDGAQTAYLLKQDSTENQHAIFATHLASEGETYGISFHAKAATLSRIVVASIFGNENVLYDLSNGEYQRYTNLSDNLVSYDMTHVGNGWYRCSLVYLSSNSTNGIGLYLLGSDDNTYFVGDGTSGVYIWGAQFEQRDTVTAYTKTNGTPITKYQPKLMTASPDDARFDHDPITGESKGLLIEEQRVNLHPRSEDFSTTDHINFSGDMFANQMIAPDGQPTATSVVMDDGKTSGGWSTTYRPAATAGVEYTFSIHIKPGDFSKFEFGLNPRLNTQGDNGASTFVYNFDTHTVEQTLTYGDAPEPTSHTVQSIGNGWYRATISAVMPANTAYLNTFAYIKDTVAGAGNNTYYVWGSQLEQGGFATSYIRTTGSQATRSADNASITGENFSSWYRQDEGSIYCEATKKDVPSSVVPVSVDGGTSDYIFLNLRSTESFEIKKNNVYQVSNLGFSGVTSGTYHKIMGAYKKDSAAVSINGLSALNDSACEIPTVNRLTIGSISGVTQNVHIKKLAYYPQRLTNEQLQNLTK